MDWNGKNALTALFEWRRRVDVEESTGGDSQNPEERETSKHHNDENCVCTTLSFSSFCDCVLLCELQ